MYKPRRVLFKLSGEMLAGPDACGIARARLDWLAGEIASARSEGAEVALVLGAGNFVRGAALAGAGIERTTADHMGMLATLINSLALAEALRAAETPSRVLSAIPCSAVAEPYGRGAAVAALEQGEVVLLAGGTGNPYFTTDTAASLRAVEIGADVLAKGTKVGGVYDKDPALHPDAKAFGTVSYDQVLAERLAVMDATAVAMCRDHSLRVLVFGLDEEGVLARVARGETPGTLMS